MNLTPIRVTAHLDTPLAGDAPCLAALCEWSMAVRMHSIMATDRLKRHQVGVRLRGEDVSEPGKVPIPIARKQVAGLPVPFCSAPIFLAWHDDREFINKKLSVERAELLHPDSRTIVATTGGLFKSYRLPLRTRCVDRVVWFCECNPTRTRADGKQTASPATWLRKILRDVWSIGKKTSDGYGRVWKWDVDIVGWAPSWFAESPAGLVLMRPLPFGDWLPANLIGARRSFGGVCPPYWQRNLYRESVVPY